MSSDAQQSAAGLPTALTPLVFAALGTSTVTNTPGVPSGRGTEAERLQKLREQAQTQGYAEGYATGSQAAAAEAAAQREIHLQQVQQQQAQALAEHQQRLEHLQAAADALEARAVPALESVDYRLLQSALSLAEAILGAELNDVEHAASAALNRVMASADPAEIRRVRMHPHTAQFISTAAQEQAGVQIVPDLTLRPGDAVADLAEGFLDARLSAALQRCRETLDRLPSAESGRSAGDVL